MEITSLKLDYNVCENKTPGALPVIIVAAGNSTRMGTDKLKRHMATGAEYITGPDSSCLMHMQGIAKKQNLPIKFIHAAEILASGL